MAPRTPIPGYRWRVLAWKGERGEKVELRFTKKDGVKFDELVIDGWFHIEEMDERVYWMNIVDRHIWVHVPYNGPAKITSEWDDSENVTREVVGPTRALEILDSICQDSLEVPLDHVDSLVSKGVLHEYDVSKLFYELREEILRLARERE